LLGRKPVPSRVIQVALQYAQLDIAAWSLGVQSREG
jgi:hypothetical protein